MKTPETKLERHVAKWLKSYGQGYDDGAQGAYDDLMQGGCQSGIVGHLIYYVDTLKFYQTHKAEINALLVEMIADTGSQPAEQFSGWDKDDPLALDTHNKNLLAWFGFEEAARRLMESDD
jgi:hypothetical protein